MKSKEDDLRLALIRFLWENHVNFNSHVIGVEAQYGTAKYRADLLLLGKNTHAFELKSEADSLRRLREQLNEYVQVFDYVWVVCIPKELSNVREIASRKVGILVFEDGEVHFARKASQFKRLSRLKLAFSCSKEQLRKAIRDSQNGTVNRGGFEELAIEASKLLSLEILRMLSHENFRSRYQSQSELFFDEVRPPVRLEELDLLKRNQTIWE